MPSKPKTLLQLRVNDCRWPLGHPGEEGFGFCAAQVCGEGEAYCARHYLAAYAPQARSEGKRKQLEKMAGVGL